MKTENFSLIGAGGVFMRQGIIRVLRYDEGNAGGPIPLIRVTSMSGSDVDVEMMPGRLVNLKEPINGMVIRNLSGATLTGKFTWGDGTVEDNTFSGVFGLDAGTLAALESVSLNVEQPSGFYQSSTAMAASGTETVFAAVSNINGAIVWSGEFATRGGVMARYAAKATALSGFVDGQTICSPSRFDYSTADNCAGIITRPIRLAAGLALFFQSIHAEAAAARSVRFTLL
ncbi:MAG: hypothetical protein EAZ11_12275 [Curvibacter sp.]|nr:MAG: hypothetical protein EAZ11_12275 [Curvibacter sp.]